MKYNTFSALVATSIPVVFAQKGAVPNGAQLPNITGFANPVISPSRGGGSSCVSGIVTVNVTSNKNVKLNFQIPQNQSAVTQTWINLITPGSPFPASLNGGLATVSGSYDIGATYCLPINTTTPATVQILTHGVGFDRYYWDFAPGYSYVDIATRLGYGVFIYDRLGVGKSSKADALSVVQAGIQVEIANTLAQRIKAGSFAGAKPQYVVGVGHSYGSIITSAVTATHPTTLDGAILTGYSTNTSGIPAFIQGLNLAIASNNDPYRFANLDKGYLVGSSPISNQIAFFHYPGFNPDIAAEAAAQKQTVTYGELFSQTVFAGPANYTRPIALVNGEEDLPFCAGNCTSDINQKTLTQTYPYNNRTRIFSVPDAGHGINLHYSAAEAFQQVQEWAKANGFT